jgi:hypothetical protein
MVGGAAANGVRRQLEALDPVRLEAEGAPDPVHRGRRQAAGGRRGARAPVRGVLRRGLERAHEQVGDPLVADGPRGAAARLVAQALEPALGEALAPLADGVLGDAQLRRDRGVAQPLGRPQHDPCPEGQRLGRLAPPRPPLQLGPLRLAQVQRRRHPVGHARASASALPF